MAQCREHRKITVNYLFGFGLSELGYTHINSSGRPNPLGRNVCDTYNPPYSRCIIEIRTNLSYKENLHTVKHELGHALGLNHKFNVMDYYWNGIEDSSNLDLFVDSEVMFTFSIYNDSKNTYKNLTIF